MNNRLFVGNLPFTTTETELRELFESHGVVTSVNIPTDRESNRPRGFGFVEFEEEASAQTALSALNGVNLGGRDLRVDTVRERPRTTPQRREARY